MHRSSDNKEHDSSPKLRVVTQSCPICEAAETLPFFELNNVPVEEGILFTSKEDAFQCPTGDIKLSYCRTCGYIWNRAYVSDLVKFDESYNISLHYSPLYEEFIRNLALRLVETYNLYGKTILEIGCGKGEFLRTICSIGENRGIGFDPTYVDTENRETNTDEITFIKDLYSAEYLDYIGDFICCRSVLESVQNPKELIRLVRRTIAERTDTVVYFEVPNTLYTFRDLVIWNIVYFNCSYFTPRSLAQLFTICDFDILSVKPCFEDDQYLGIDAVPDNSAVRSGGCSSAFPDDMFSTLNLFAEKYQLSVDYWQKKLNDAKKYGQKIIAWGAGARAISFLNTYNITQQIKYVVDINPVKQDKYLPVTGQRVVPPEFIVSYKPDVVIVTNPTFDEEIRQQVQKLGLTCEFLLL
jgi:SAM-dependent methyltransferase